jgi:hypothetical protein
MGMKRLLAGFLVAMILGAGLGCGNDANQASSTGPPRKRPQAVDESGKKAKQPTIDAGAPTQKPPPNMPR